MNSHDVTRRDMLKLAGVLGAVGLAGMPRAAFASEDSDEERFFLGFSLHPTGPNSTAGTFVLSGRFQDSGVSTAENIALTPIDQTDRSRLSGDQQFVGQQGTIFTRFEGVSFPNSSPHAVGEGSFTIVSGTGAYAGINGQGSFLIVVDFVSNQFIGTEIGNAAS